MHGCNKNKTISDTPPILNTDCCSLFDHISKKKLPVSEKRLMVELSAPSEAVDRGEVTLHWVPTDAQLADPVTKHTYAVPLQKALISGEHSFH